jgi:organic radical activating enzyme
LRITGGEPLMHKSTWRLFEELKENPKPHLNIELNSNMGVKEKLVKKLVETLKELKSLKAINSFKLYTSIDTWGPRASYTRTGLDIGLWERNLDYYLTNTGWPVTFMITFNLFAVTSFNKLLEKILEWRHKYNSDMQTKWQRIRFDTPYLRDPIQFDMNILPKEKFMPYMKKHLQMMHDYQDDTDRTKFSSLEVEKFRRVVDYMEKTQYDKEKLQKGRKNFYNFFTQYDSRRNIKLIEVFPELENFYMDCSTLV